MSMLTCYPAKGGHDALFNSEAVYPENAASLRQVRSDRLHLVQRDYKERWVIILREC